MKKKRDGIKISNRLFYTLVVIGILVIVGAGVYAIGNTPNAGHSISELQTCDEGKILQVVDGEWDCVSGGSSTEMTKIRAYKSDSQTIHGGSYTKVTFDTEEFDTNQEFYSSTSRFLPYEAGYYFIHAHVLAQELGNLENWRLWIEKNGDSIAESRYVSPGAGEDYNPTLDVFTISYISLNQPIDVWTYQTQGNDRVLSAGKDNTYIEIYRIS